MDKVINVVIAGLGGQGVLRASDVLAEAAFRAGYDVKKAEVHGMSQRGGSVTSDVRFGRRVLSPMVPPGEADCLVVLEESQTEPTKYYLRAGGTLLTPAMMDLSTLPSAKALNVAMLGMLSSHLAIPSQAWHMALRSHFPAKLHDANEKAFQAGKDALGGKEGKP
jgi:indolepyruvate ferredoxin oxidoreductase, beta subunit